MAFGETQTAGLLLVRLPFPWQNFASPTPTSAVTMVTLRETFSILASKGRKHFQEPAQTGKPKEHMPLKKASGLLETGSWLNSAPGRPHPLQAQHLRVRLLPALLGLRVPRGLPQCGPRLLVLASQHAWVGKRYLEPKQLEIRGTWSCHMFYTSTMASGARNLSINIFSGFSDLLSQYAR